MKRIFILFNLLFILSLQSVFCEESILIKYYELFLKAKDTGFILPEISQNKKGEWVSIEGWNMIVDEKNYYIGGTKDGSGGGKSFVFAIYLTPDRKNAIAGISFKDSGNSTYGFYRLKDAMFVDVRKEIFPDSMIFKDGMDWKKIYESFKEYKPLRFESFYDVECEIPEYGTVTKFKLVRKHPSLTNISGKKLEKLKDILKEIESNIVREDISLEWNYKKSVFVYVKNETNGAEEDQFLTYVKGNNIDKVKELIKKGVNVNVKNEDGYTALIWASLLSEDTTEIVKLLIEAKADVNAKNKNNWTALIWASWSGHTEVVKILIEAKADVSARDDYGWTALIRASYGGYTEIVKLLLEVNADVNVKSKDGDTALMWASSGGYIEVVKLLLEAKADVNVRDKDGWTALHFAESERHNDIVELLKKHGAKE